MPARAAAAAAPLPAEALPALADAIGGLGEFLGRVKEREGFNATDVAIAAEIQQELEAVRRIATPVLDTALPPEITFADAEPELARDEIALPQIALDAPESAPAPLDKTSVPDEAAADVRCRPS